MNRFVSSLPHVYLWSLRHSILEGFQEVTFFLCARPEFTLGRYARLGKGLMNGAGGGAPERPELRSKVWETQPLYRASTPLGGVLKNKLS